MESDVTRLREHYRYLIIGGGMVAGYAAGELAERGLRPGECAIVSADADLPYERPPLSKSFLAGEDARADLLIHDDAFYRDRGIDVRLDARVTAIDAAGHSVTLGDGSAVRYSSLVIATGARPRTLPVPGNLRAGVHSLRSLRDAESIRSAMATATDAAVIGGGFIGMEVAASLAGRGLRTTVVDRGARLGERVFTPEISRFFESYYADRGVRLLRGEGVASFDGGEAVTGITLSSGARVEAGLVVLGVGVEPAVELARDAGLSIDNGIVVDEYLRTSAPDVYAAGDVARYRDLLYGTCRRVEHWDNAVEQGKHVARMLMGADAAFIHVPYFFSDVFDLSYEFWGDPDGADAVVYRGDVATRDFSAWWIKGNCVTAAMVMKDRPPEERDIAPRWIAEREYVSERRLKHPAFADAL